MKNIIEPISVHLIEKELEKANFIRHTRKAQNKIYITDAHSSPNIMREIGRLREIAFRDSGGGSGNEVDIDSKDTSAGYKQLIVWSADEREIIGGYRYIMGQDVKFNSEGQPIMAMAHIFNFPPTFINDYLPNTLELGRAFIQPKYQSPSGGIKSIYSLDNLWDGIGAIVALNPHLKYLIGKVTIYSQTPEIARNAIIHYMNYYFEKNSDLLIPKKREIITTEQCQIYQQYMCLDDFKKDIKNISSFVKKHGSIIPPLFQAYIDLSDTLTSFGTVFDPDFGKIYDTGIMLTLDDIYKEKKERYIDTYLKEIAAN